jgi:hypothetical protein
MALSALIMRRDGEKQTSVKMRRDSGSGNRLKSGASLGQLKRSRLSLANMNDNETQPNPGGGMNTTWSSPNDQGTVATGGLHPQKQNMFSSIISGSSHRHSSNTFSSTGSKCLPSLSPTTDLDTALPNNGSSVKKVEGMPLVLRNKSDLRQMLGASVHMGNDLHKSASSDSIRERF